MDHRPYPSGLRRRRMVTPVVFPYFVLEANVTRRQVQLAVAYRPRQLLGLRRSPGRLAVAVFRMPLRAYQHNAGWLLGRTFLLLVHTGRKTGQPHSTVAMVLCYDALTREAAICSAWGPRTDWVRNLRAGPAVHVQIGHDSYIPQHRFLAEDESLAVAAHFRGEHPWRLRLLSAILGWGDLRNDTTAREFVRTHPFVALRPTVRQATCQSCAGRAG